MHIDEAFSLSLGCDFATFVNTGKLATNDNACPSKWLTWYINKSADNTNDNQSAAMPYRLS